MIRLTTTLLAGAALIVIATHSADARSKAKPVDKPCGTTIAECENAIVKALAEGNDFNFVAAGPLPPKVAEAFVRAISGKYERSSCLDQAARDSLPPDRLAAVKRSGRVELYKPDGPDVDVMVHARNTLIARKTFLEKAIDVRGKLPFKGEPIVVRTNPIIGEDITPVQDACGHETLGRIK
jgi:hypothetical protein